MKKKLFSKDDDGNVAVKKLKLSFAHPASIPTPPATPTAASPESTATQWHSSLICLKASNPMGPTCNNNSDDIMEEDEIKLFEFLSNCQWERSKKEILTAITNTLKRGVYPQPRVMVIGDFRVEILPKAARPSPIPMELRSKLPKAMYSVRVKVTENPKPREPAHKVSVSKNSVLIPTTTIPAFYSGVSSIQGLLPMPGLLPGHGSVLGVGSAPTIVSSSSASVSSAADAVSSGNVGISGLGRLQITQNKVASNDMVGSQGQSVQHFKIQKDGAGVSSATSGEPGEKKKKKKKKKKKSVDPGDDSLVPDLSNLTVSPRGSNSSSAAGSPPVVTPFKPPSRSGSSSLKPPVVAQVSPSLITQPISMQQFSKLPIPSTGAAAVRPHLLSFPTLPANLSGVKFLQLPGQNNLLQIVPASALGLKAMDNKNVPNFVAVPVSLTSVATAGLGGKKAGSRVQVDVPSKVFTQAQQDIAQQSAAVAQSASKETTPGAADNSHRDSVSGAAATSADGAVNSEGASVKKKKKRRRKKQLGGEGSAGDSGTQVPASPVVTSPILVASSPSPVMSSALPYPVQMVKNTHAAHTAGDSTTDQQRAMSRAASAAGLCPGVVSHTVAGGITVTASETTVTLTKWRPSTDKSEVTELGQEGGSTQTCQGGSGDATDATQHHANPPGPSDAAQGTAHRKPRPCGTTASSVLTATKHAPLMQPNPGTLQDGTVDEDSRWSGADSLDLAVSSDSEVKA